MNVTRFNVHTMELRRIPLLLGMWMTIKPLTEGKTTPFPDLLLFGQSILSSSWLVCIWTSSNVQITENWRSSATVLMLRTGKVSYVSLSCQRLENTLKEWNVTIKKLRSHIRNLWMLYTFPLIQAFPLSSLLLKTTMAELLVSIYSMG